MIAQLRGKLIEKNPTEVVIDCHGVCYQVHISLYTFSQLPDNEDIRLHTLLMVREDAHTLYGFYTRQEKEIFRLLISVNGVGASTARTMLSSLSTDQIIQAISKGDVAVIQSAKGIGSKTAQRILVDLKDKVLTLYDGEQVPELTGNSNKEEALSALEVLGFSRKQAEKTLNSIAPTMYDAPVELLIKEALKNL